MPLISTGMQRQLFNSSLLRRVRFGLGVCVLILLVARTWIWLPTLITGTSMEPTLKGRQLAVVNKVAYWFSPPARGEIVAVWTGRELLIKRIVGLPGEEIALCDGTYYINGEPLSEPYLRSAESHQSVGCGKINTGCFVVAGDNRTGGSVAVINQKRIVGRLICSAKGRCKASAPNRS